MVILGTDFFYHFLGNLHMLKSMMLKKRGFSTKNPRKH